MSDKHVVVTRDEKGSYLGYAWGIFKRQDDKALAIYDGYPIVVVHDRRYLEVVVEALDGAPEPSPKAPRW